MLERTWRLAEPLASGSLPDLDAWPHPMRQLLYNRGLRSEPEIVSFLYPDESAMHDPFSVLGMDTAVERIFRALRNEELIGIYGDFDVDGLTAAALLGEVLESQWLQGRVVTYLPHRTREGYGLNGEAIRQLAAQGVTLLITVDCGIGADGEISLAGALGMDVVVTDHHQVTSGVPAAVAVLNPRQDGCSYRFKDLAGAGMAYKLAEALLSRVWGPDAARERLRSVLDLVALGTIADLALLQGENRVLAKLGLECLNRRDRPGLRALAAAAGMNGRQIDVESISFALAPRLNAAGRMGDARRSLDLLRATTEAEATRLAVELDEANRSRQLASSAAIEAARAEISGLPETPPVIFLVGPYPAGVLGLVAGRLAEEYGRPAFVLELGETECRGSVRGAPGFDVANTLAGASDLLLRYGGHGQAGGFGVETARIAQFRARMEAATSEQLGPAAPPPELLIEAALRVREVGPRLHEYLTMLEPCGVGNERPVFGSFRVRVRDSRVVGGSHLKLWLADETGVGVAIGFGMALRWHQLARPGTIVDCAYTVGRREYGGTTSYEMVLRDLRVPAAAPNVL